MIGGSLKFDRAVFDPRNEAKKEGLCYTVDLWIIESQLHLERTDVIITWYLKDIKESRLKLSYLF